MISGIDASVEKDEDNLLDACRVLSKEGMLDLVDVIGLKLESYQLQYRRRQTVQNFIIIGQVQLEPS